MSERTLPRYPVYILSKGRADCCYTAQSLVNDNVPFYLVIEPTEVEAYAAQFDTKHLLILPFHDLGLGGIPARNFIWEHALASGVERHWTLDDNSRGFYRRWNGKRLYCDAGIALRVCEDFTDRYENIGISGLNYRLNTPDDRRIQPVQINCHVYSCVLLLTGLQFRWRGRYNEDTDLCLQVLSTGAWCTVLLNTFLMNKQATMTMKGGNATMLYQGDGRLKMARSLERVWPGIVTTDRRFHRPQHVVNWKRFDTPLRLKAGIDLAALPPNEYGMSLVQVADEIKSPRLQALVQGWQETHGEDEVSHA